MGASNGAAPGQGGPRKDSRVIGRRLAVGFGSVSVVAIVMCAMLVSIIQDVAGHVDSMRHDESSIRQGTELATAVREMSIHIAGAVIEGDEPELERYGASRDRVRARIQTLAARVPVEARDRLEALGATTQRMHERLVGTAVPALRRGDRVAVQEAYAEIRRLGEQAAQQADIWAAATTQQMAHAHDHATDSTRLGLIGGGLCALLIVGLAIAFTLRLRSVVLRPLQRLTDASLRYGRGDFAFRLGEVGQGEFATVGDAFGRMADELAQREARLLHNERMAAIGQFAAGIAHELNNPIGIIRGYLKTMSPDEDRDTLAEELAILDEEAGHCQRIADDLLSYARAEDLNHAAIDMNVFMEETATRYRTANGGATVQVEAEEAVVEADAARLRQVLLNLLNNARQVSPEGASVRVVGAVHAGHYRIDVMDEGPGIRPDESERIFEPFYSTRKGGSGLGLAVCQGIVKAHGGTIEVARDGASSGATLRLQIPRTRAASPSMEAGS
ncbi:MAG: ATP-binding protein [Myxococcota bacterium]